MEGHQLLATKKTSLAIPPAIVAWLKQEYVVDRERTIPKERLYAAYENYCRHQLRMKPKDPNTFGKFVARVFPHVFTRRLGPISHQVTHYSGIGPRPEAPYPSPSSSATQQQPQQAQQHPQPSSPARRRKTKQQQQQPVPYLPLPTSPYLHGLPSRNPHQPPPCSLNSPEGALLNLHYKPPGPHSQQPQQQQQQQQPLQQSATEQHTPSSRKRKTPSPPPCNSEQHAQPAEQQQPPLSRGLSDYSLSGDELHSSVSVSPSQQMPSPNSSPCPSPRCPVKEECEASQQQHRLHYTSVATCSSSAPSSPLSLPSFTYIETPRPPRSMSFADSYKAPPSFFENQHYYLFSNSNSYIYNRDNDHHTQHSYSNKRVKREEVSLREVKQEPIVHSRRESMVIVEEREEEEPEWAFFVSSGPRTC